MYTIAQLKDTTKWYFYKCDEFVSLLTPHYLRKGHRVQFNACILPKYPQIVNVSRSV